MIASEAGWIDAKSWKDDIGTEFPVRVTNCFIDTVRTSVSDYPIEIKQNCDSDNVSVEAEEITVAIISENGDDIFTQIQISPHLINPEINGKIRIRAYDKKYQYTFRIE